MPDNQQSIRLSLHHLTVDDASHEEFIDIASELGCDHVCLFLGIPNVDDQHQRVRTVQQARELNQRLADKGMSAFNTDTFIVTPQTRIKDHEGTLEIARALGAPVIDIVSFDPDLEATAAVISEFLELAHSYGLRCIIEPMPRAGIKDIDDAMDVIARCGDPALGLNIDVLHLMRSGRRPADLAKIEPSRRYYAQISDAMMEGLADMKMMQSATDRMIPGEGEFPLVEFVRMLPPGGVLSVECPLTRLKDRFGALERARMAVAGARSVLAQAGL